MEIVFGFTIGYLAYRFSNEKTQLAGLISIIISLLTSLVLILIIESLRQSANIRKLEENIGSLLKVVSKQFSNYGSLIDVLEKGFVKVSREQVPDLWMQCLWKVNKRYWGTSYVKPDEGWNQAITKLGLEIQKAKIAVNSADVKRIFIIDNDAELKDLQHTMYDQIKVGIKTKYIYREKIEKLSLLSSWASDLVSLDFGIVDNDYVSIVCVDKRRKIKSGQVLFGKDYCDQYEQFYTSLFKEANDVEF